jgi:hypothetical protein
VKSFSSSKARALIAWAFAIASIAGVIQIVSAGLLLRDVFTDLQKVHLTSAQEASAQLDGISKQSRLASLLMTGPAIWGFEQLPYVGRYVKGAHVAADLASNSTSRVREALEHFPNNKLKSVSGISDAQWRYVAAQGSALFDELTDGLRKLSALNIADAAPKPLDGILSKPQNTIRSLATLRNYAIAAETILGNPKPSTWFIANQNLAESRGTGGLIGSYALIRVQGGRLNLLEAGSDADLMHFGPIYSDKLPIQPEAIWGMVQQSDWRDVNASANPELAALQIKDSVRHNMGRNIDGVLFLGQGVTSHLVAAFGPVLVDGKTISSKNSVSYLTTGIYSKYSDPRIKNLMVKEFLMELLRAATTTQPHLGEFGKAVLSDRTGDRIYVWSSEPKLRRSLAEAGLLSSLNESNTNAFFISLNNAAGNKLDAYTAIQAKLDYCQNKHRQVRLRLKVTNQAPSEKLPGYVNMRLDKYATVNTTSSGSNRDLLSVYLPRKSRLRNFEVDGNSTSIGDYTDTEREVLVFDLEMATKESHYLSLTLDTAPTSTAETIPLEFSPMLQVPAFTARFVKCS